MKIPILVGPTSTGKTSITLNISSKTSAHIISADSRQVYKYMDIGTGKLPVNLVDTKIEKNDGFWKINDCSIWGYDLVKPDQTFNSFEFAKFALNKIVERKSEGTPIIVVGGTGFFIDTLTGLVNLNAAEPDLALREHLNSKSLEELNFDLEKLSTEQAAKVDKKNKIRIIRAIERLTIKGDEKPKLNREGLEFEYYGLTATRDVLYPRVDTWAESIWGEPLFNELRTLHIQGFTNTAPLKGLVYKTAVQHLNKEITFEQGLERTKFDLHAYIRRQQTWFKKNASIKWFDIAQEKDIVSIVSKSLYN